MSAFLQQAVAAHQAGHLDEAERLYRDTLKEQPKQPDALALLGVLLATRGDLAEGINLIEEAIKHDPKTGLFKFHLGNALMAAKRLPEAIKAFQEAIQQQPGLAEAHHNLANALRSSDDWVGAIGFYKSALQCKPSYLEAYNNLALTLSHEKRYDEAITEIKKAITLEPRYGDGWLTLCNIAEQVKDYPLALKAGEHNIELLPDNHRAWFGYGVALNRLDRNEEAVIAYKRALELKPERVDIWDNLSQTYQSLNQLDKAEATFRKTIEVAGQTLLNEEGRLVSEEEYGNRHWHLALVELLRGKYKPGFARYRSRFKNIASMERPKFLNPLWKGEDLKNKTILICDEQGFGDTLMLCRYLPLLKSRGARIIFSVHLVLEPLFKSWPVVDQIIVHGEKIPGYDYYASVFDLPHLLGTEVHTIPADIPYLPLFAADDETQLPKKRIPQIGVVWGGSPIHLNDMRRSIPLKLFAELFAVEGLEFFSLNRDKKPGDDELLPYYPVTDLAPRLKSFADGARLIGQLDLVITVDTATAHLAGGMGKPVWTLLPFAPDWRWMTDREDTPWYPTMKLFRQQKISDWEGVIARVKKALSQFAEERSRRS